jgi:gas vesicle protein
MKTDKVLLGLLSGMAAGAILGVLFAPDKGTATRKKLKDKSTDYAGDFKGKVDSALETISKKYDDLKSEGQDLYAKGKSKFEDTKNEVASEVKKEAHNINANL